VPKLGDAAILAKDAVPCRFESRRFDVFEEIDLRAHLMVFERYSLKARQHAGRRAFENSVLGALDIHLQ